MLNGNQMASILTYYLLERGVEKGMFDRKSNPGFYMVKTIVTTDLLKSIAGNYGVEMMDVLTGFKYIAEVVRMNEGKRKFIGGGEESYGFNAGEFVRDKDAVIAAMLVCEMTLYYKSKGKTLYEALMDLYMEYGFFKESLVSIELTGKEGQEKIAATIDYLRNTDLTDIAHFKVAKKLDYKLSIERDLATGDEDNINLPKSNVLKFVLNDGSWFVVRPSGTEPKMKVYIATIGTSMEHTEENLKVIEKAVLEYINKLTK
jgi:phosphoglucomutase